MFDLARVTQRLSPFLFIWLLIYIFPLFQILTVEIEMVFSRNRLKETPAAVND